MDHYLLHVDVSAVPAKVWPAWVEANALSRTISVRMPDYLTGRQRIAVRATSHRHAQELLAELAPPGAIERKPFA